MAKRGIPRLFRYAVLNSVISFFVTAIAAHSFILPSDLGSEGNSIANVIILAFCIFVSLGNLTYLLIPIKRLPIVNLVIAFSWFSILSFTWIYFSPDGAGIKDQSIKYVFFFYTGINTLLGIGTAFWYHRVIIKILGPARSSSIFSMQFLEKIFPKNNTRSLQQLIEGARSAGLEAKDLQVAEEYLNNREFGLCFDHIVTQLHEYNIPISKDYYDTIVKAGTALELSSGQYSFAKELIRND